MNPEELLGGYATGTLSPEEKALLFKAALKDQALFDALMDEEILRELLADPKARKRLLAILPHRKPLVLRPQFMALAAGLLLVVAAAYMLETRRAALGPVAEQSTATPEAPGPAPLPKADKSREAEAPRLSKGRAKEEAPAREDAPVQAEALLAGRASEASRDSLPSAPAPRAAAKANRAPFPIFRVERQPDGALVLWGGSGYLYVLKRHPGGTELLAPSETRSREEGGLSSAFHFSLKAGEKVDIYLMPGPVADPVSLAPAPPSQGLWQRLEP